MEKISQIGRGEVVDGLKGSKKDFEIDSKFDREPVEMLESRGDVVE